MSKFKVGEEVLYKPLIRQRGIIVYSGKKDNMLKKYLVKVQYSDGKFHYHIARENQLSKLPENKFKFKDILKSTYNNDKVLVQNYSKNDKKYTLIKYYPGKAQFYFLPRCYVESYFKKVGEIDEF